MDIEKINGYTIAETIISLLLVTLILTLLAPLFQLFSIDNRQQELSIRQFFTFTSDELAFNDIVSVQSTRLELLSYHGELITIERYGSSVRRQVGGRGHEVLLRDIETIQFTLQNNQLLVVIKSLGGKSFEKRLQTYTSHIP
ncbi:competence protein ComGF [Thalassobacillus cyri]|uniref:Competence protein ComGF n=1 Tax=Thalassobacillus cyri TaxID=571932 RepID=A0A1H4GS21_9BACI|nr:ComGF family competence protein [Thalassobacillus cyri]SEB12449.1 competence protein ComGF [Thalassobacillus cyri]